MNAPSIRIGHGYDLHRMTHNRKLILGGVEIPHTKGLLGHSDADCLYHSLADSILGALALSDIGHYFPDTDPNNKDLDSSVILKKAFNECESKGYSIANLDITIIAQKPKLSDFLPSMKKNIGGILEIQTDRIGIKATTNEKVGPIGREEAIACFAVTLLQKIA